MKKRIDKTDPGVREFVEGALKDLNKKLGWNLSAEDVEVIADNKEQKLTIEISVVNHMKGASNNDLAKKESMVGYYIADSEFDSGFEGPFETVAEAVSHFEKEKRFDEIEDIQDNEVLFYINMLEKKDFDFKAEDFLTNFQGTIVEEYEHETELNVGANWETVLKKDWELAKKLLSHILEHSSSVMFDNGSDTYAYNIKTRTFRML